MVVGVWGWLEFGDEDGVEDEDEEEDGYDECVEDDDEVEEYYNLVPLKKQIKIWSLKIKEKRKNNSTSALPDMWRINQSKGLYSII